MTCRRIRLLHLLSACTVGGCEAHALALLGQLDSTRYDRWLAYFEERPDDARPMLGDFQALGVRTVDLQGRGQLDPASVARLAALLRREQFDLVHCHSLRAEVAAVAASALVSPRPRLIRTVHNTDEFYIRPPASWLARLSCRRLDAVIAISDAVADHVQTHAGLSASKVRRIYYGLNTRPYAAVQPLEVRANDTARRPTIGMIARLAPQKGHRVLLDALPAVVARVPELQVELVGHEHLLKQDELKQYATGRGVADHVTFTGFRDDLPALFAGWDLVVLPSLWEGFGLVLLEAMAAGRPIVASRVGAIPEVVVHGETGLLVEPNRPEALAEALLELLEQPALAARFGAAGRRRVAEQFSLQQMVEQTETLYLDLLGAACPPRVAA